MSKKLCILCHRRPAEVPDRERMERPMKRVCRKCHAGRLRGDLEMIAHAHAGLRKVQP